MTTATHPFENACLEAARKKTGAPETEIEITPEMIEVGTDIAWRAPLMEPDDKGIRQMVIDIFRTMLRVSPTHHP
jgi:hypothetical protein